jgi:hypothetical protein
MFFESGNILIQREETLNQYTNLVSAKKNQQNLYHKGNLVCDEKSDEIKLMF